MQHCSKSCLCSFTEFRSIHMGTGFSALAAISSPFKALARWIGSTETHTLSQHQVPSHSARCTEVGAEWLGFSTAGSKQSFLPIKSSLPHLPFEKRTRARSAEKCSNGEFKPVTKQGTTAASNTPLRTHSHSPKPRVLRVIHSGHPEGGKLVISGRMADVCAELDRLAGHECPAFLQ
jgi:hypothetical protein